MAFSITKSQKSLIDPAKTSPRYLLHKHLRRTEEARSYAKVHASDLMGRTDFCPREYALGLKHHNPRKGKAVYTHESVTYAYGYAVEDLVRRWFSELDVAHGDWQCHACDKLYNFQRRPHQCKCGSKSFEYREITFKSEISGVTCRPDLFIDFGRPKLTILEVKSIDKEEFKKIVAPLAEHRWRTNAYMRLIEESDSPHKDRIDLENAFVFYITKGGYGVKDDEIRRWKLLDGDWSPFKEFNVKRNDEETQEKMDMGAAVEEYKRTGKVPLGICPTSLVKRAKFCHQYDHCWE